MIRLVFNKEQFFPSCVLTSVMVAMIQLKSGVNQIETRHESDQPPFLYWQSFCISAKCPDKGGLIVNAGWQIERLEPVWCVVCGGGVAKGREEHLHLLINLTHTSWSIRRQTKRGSMKSGNKITLAPRHRA